MDIMDYCAWFISNLVLHIKRGTLVEAIVTYKMSFTKEEVGSLTIQCKQKGKPIPCSSPCILKSILGHRLQSLY